MLDKLGQLMMIGIQGTELTEAEADFIVRNDICGVTLFGRNVESPKQIYELCTELHSLRHKTRDKIPLIIAIDMEGGRVARLKEPFTQWPPLKKIGDLDSTSTAFNFAMAMGQELRSLGINLDFAPCVDVLTNPKNVLIGDRSISTDPEQVAKMASALVRGYIKAEVIPCAKHFPGHGNTIVDSHEDLPVDDTDLETLRERELVPFKKSFRARLDMVMTAHIKFSKVDPENPVTLSSRFLKEILRDELRYRNIIISDDLDMKALSKHHPLEEIPVRALQAGCDLILYCNEFDHPPMALEALKKALKDGQLTAHTLDESYQRIINMKKSMLQNPDPWPFEKAAAIIGCAEHKALSEAIATGQAPTKPT